MTIFKLYILTLLLYASYLGFTWDRNLLDSPEQWQEVYLGDSSKSQLSDITISKDTIAFTLLLTGERFKHFGGLGRLLPAGERNLSRYDDITIELTSTGHYTTLLTANLMDNGDTLVTEKILKSSQKKYSFKLKDLAVPHWWDSSSHSEMTGISFRECDGILIGSSMAFSDHQPEPVRFTITELRVHRNFLHILKTRATLLLPVALFAVLSLILKRRRSITFTNNPQKCSDLETYIGESFSCEDLCEKRVTQELNLPPGALDTFCRKRLDCGFSEYLRIIRIAESERLLTETSLQIKEIAGKVGYRHVTAFNRDFKKITGVTPGSFRN